MQEDKMRTVSSAVRTVQPTQPATALRERFPTFLIVGVAKAGTSSLYDYLGQHPQIFISPVRAPNFFGLGEQPGPAYGGPVKSRPIHAPTLEAYHALFEGRQNESALGEGSSYFNFTPRAAARIQHYISQARLLIILRQPAERAYSQYLYARRMGWEPATTFQAALDEEPRRQAEGWFPFLCYRESSLYADKLRAFYDRFPAEQLHLCLFDDFRRQPAVVVNQIYRFLGVTPDFTPDVSVHHNPATVGLCPWLRSPHNEKAARFWRYLPGWLRQRLFQQLSKVNVVQLALEPRLRRQLTAEFHNDIVATQSLIGRALSQWLIS